MRLTPLNLWIFLIFSIKKISKFFKPVQVLNRRFFCNFRPVFRFNDRFMRRPVLRPTRTGCRSGSRFDRSGPVLTTLVKTVKRGVLDLVSMIRNKKISWLKIVMKTD